MAKAKAVATAPAAAQINIGRVKESCIDKALDLNGISVTKGATVAQKTAALQAYYATLPPARLVPCEGDDGCGGLSDELLDACPFCGLSDVDPNDVAEETEVASAETEIKAPDTILENAAPDPAALPKRAKKGRAPKNDGLAEVITGDPSTAITAAPALTAEMQAAEAALNGSVAEINQLSGSMYSNSWDIGRVIAKILANNEHKARLDAKGKPLYKDFNTFVRAELHIGPTTARDFADISTKFTKEQFAAIGQAKLATIIKIPPQAQMKLLETAAQRPLSELKATVAAIRAETGYVRDSSVTGRGKNKPGGGKKVSVTPAVEGKVTVAMMLDKAVNVFFFKRPEKRGDDLVPGTLADLKKGEKLAAKVELSNRVELLFNLTVTASGQVKAAMKAVRPAKVEE